MSDISNVLRKVIELDISLGLDGTQEALDEITRLTAEVRVRQTIVEEARDERDAAFAEVEKLRAALLVARKYVLVQSCELSLQPDDAARDLDVIDEALEEDDD
jgi:hypothetical protein